MILKEPGICIKTGFPILGRGGLTAKFEEQVDQILDWQEQAANTSSTPGPVLARPPGELERMGVGMDGALIFVLEEGWKELKVGCLFQVIQKDMLDKTTLEMERLRQATQNTYVAHLGGPEKFRQML